MHVSGSLRFSGNLAVTLIELPALSEIGGDFLLVDNPKLTNVLASNLRKVGGGLSCYHNSQLHSLRLPALREAPIQFSLHNNTSLSEIDAGHLAIVGAFRLSLCSGLHSASFPALAEIGVAFILLQNEKLSVFEASRVATIGVRITVRLNVALLRLHLPALVSVGGLLTIAANELLSDINLERLSTIQRGSLQIVGNNALPLVRLPALTSVGGNESGTIHIHSNALLTSVVLIKLTRIGNNLMIYNDSLLYSIRLPALLEVGGQLEIRDNKQLAMIDMDSVTTVGQQIVIFGNNNTLPYQGLRGLACVGEASLNLTGCHADLALRIRAAHNANSLASCQGNGPRTPATACSPPVAPANGTLSGDCSGTLHSVCKLTCNDGYVPSDIVLPDRMCSLNGLYSSPGTVCQPSACLPLGAPSNGTVTGACDGHYTGDICTAACDAGFVPSVAGTATRTCGQGGSYNGTAISCVTSL